MWLILSSDLNNLKNSVAERTSELFFFKNKEDRTVNGINIHFFDGNKIRLTGTSTGAITLVACSTDEDTYQLDSGESYIVDFKKIDVGSTHNGSFSFKLYDGTSQTSISSKTSFTINNPSYLRVAFTSGKTYDTTLEFHLDYADSFDPSWEYISTITAKDIIARKTVANIENKFDSKINNIYHEDIVYAIDTPVEKTAKGVTITRSGNQISFNGTATASIYFSVSNDALPWSVSNHYSDYDHTVTLEINEGYIISYEVISGTADNLSNTAFAVRGSDTSTYLALLILNNAQERSFKTTEANHIITGFIRSGAIFNDYTIKLKLEKLSGIKSFEKRIKTLETENERSQKLASSSFYVANDDIALIPNYDDLIAAYDELLIQNPSYVTKNTLSQNDFVNYEYVFETPNYNDNSGRRDRDPIIQKLMIMICAGIHGYERSSVMSLYSFLKSLCENDYSLSGIKNGLALRVIPVENPWGYTNNIRYNQNGIDLNRNFNTSTWTNNDTSGNAPADQVETQLMQNWIDTNIDDAVMLIDWHNSSFVNECSVLIGENSDYSKNIKLSYLKQIDIIIEYLNKKRNVPYDQIYAYTGDSGVKATQKGYVKEKGKLAYTFETSWDIANLGRYSAKSIAIGAELFGNMLIGIKRYLDLDRSE